MLLEKFLALTAQWRPVFARQPSWRRAVGQALGSLLCLGRTSVSRILLTAGRGALDWSADYYLHSRSRWDADPLFQPIIEGSLAWCRGRWLAVVIDETRLKKTGRRVAGAGWQRDPLGPPFQIQLQWGLRFVQAAVLLPLYRRGEGRALPVRFSSAPAPRRPKKKAVPEEWKQYRQAQAARGVSARFVAQAQGCTGIWTAPG